MRGVSYYTGLSVKVTKLVEELSSENAAAGSAAKSVVGKAYKLPVKHCVLSETACSYSHTAVDLTVSLALRTVILFKISNELLGSVGESVLLGKTLKALPSLQDLFLCGLILKVYKNGSCVTVCYRNSQALACDRWCCSVDDLAVDNFTPDLHWLKLRFFLLAANERNDVINDLRHCLKCLAGAGNCLICAGENLGTSSTPRLALLLETTGHSSFA